MTLALVSAAWNRPDIEALVLGYYARLEVPGLEMMRFVATTGGSRYDGWTSIECENRPLGRKWNRAFAAARATDPDAYLTIGSDDLLEPAFFEFVAEHGSDYDWIEQHRLYLYQRHTRRAVVLMNAAPGAGVFFSRAYMDLLGGVPYSDEATIHIDAAPRRAIESVDWTRRLRTPQFRLVDIKDGRNMHSLDAMLVGVVKDVDPDTLFDPFRGYVTEADINGTGPARP